MNSTRVSIAPQVATRRETERRTSTTISMEMLEERSMTNSRGEAMIATG